MSNPMFNDAALDRAGGTAVLDRPGSAEAFDATTFSAPPPAATVTVGRTMTYGGTCSAAVLMLVVLAVAGWFGWQTVEETTSLDPQTGEQVVTATLGQPGWLIVGALVGLGLALVTAFKPHLARVTAIPYSIAQGYVVGAISGLYDAQFEGIVVQAVLATMGVFLVMLTLYGLRVLRATPRFVKGVVAATLGILAMYVVGFVASLFGADLRFWSEPSPLGIAISVVIVIVAALNLVIDFDTIERGVTQRWPAAMEWFGAFALVVTLVWLYLEMLRLLAKLRSQ